jgi:hypothetical protein
MSKCLLVFIFFLLSLSNYGQLRQFVLQIDTLDTEELYDFAIYVNYNADLGNESLAEDSLRIRQRGKYPNFRSSFIFNSDTSILTIPIDNGLGWLHIRGIYHSGYDTIRIARLKVYDDCYSDTTFITSQFYYKRINEPLPEPYKIKHNKSIIKKRCKNKVPFEITYYINKKAYTVPIKMEMCGIYITDWQAYTSTKYNKNPEAYKGKVAYVTSQSTRKCHANIANVQLGN